MVSTLLNPDARIFTRKLIKRAMGKLDSFDKGEIPALTLKHGKGGVLYKIDIGHHRLVSKDRTEWVLFTHESYNYLFQFKH